MPFFEKYSEIRPHFPIMTAGSNATGDYRYLYHRINIIRNNQDVKLDSKMPVVEMTCERLYRVNNSIMGMIKVNFRVLVADIFPFLIFFLLE